MAPHHVSDRTLAGALAAVHAGRGRCVAVTGPAGIGKSWWLASAVAEAEAEGLGICRATAQQMETMVPFGVAAQLFPEVEADRRHGAEVTVEALLRAAGDLVWPDPESPLQRPQLIMVDDLHWADAGSIGFVAALAERTPELPIVLAIGVRTDGSADAAALVERFGGRLGATVLPLAPLKDTGIERILAEHLGTPPSGALVTAVLRASGGNPFFAHAVARELAEQPEPDVASVASLLPAEVLRSVPLRFAAAGDSAARLAAALSVLGDGTPLRLVAVLADVPGREAENLADRLAVAGLLAAGEPLRFAHPLIGAAVRAAQRPFALARLHRRAADALMLDGASPERIGEQLVATRPDGDPAVVDQLQAAAAVAGDRGDAAGAVRFLERASIEPPMPHERPELVLKLLDAQLAASDRRPLDDVEGILRELPGRRQQTRALLILATLSHLHGTLEDAIALVRRGLDVAEGDDPRHRQLRARWLGSALLHPEHHPTASAELRAVIAAAAVGPVDESPAVLALAANEAITAGEPDQVIHRLVRLAVADDPLVEPDSAGVALGFAASAIVWSDGLDEAARLLDRAVTAATRRGAVVELAVAHHWLGIAALYAGNPEQAVAHGEETASLHERGLTDAPWSVPLLIDAWLTLGELELARMASARGGRADPARSDHVMLCESRARLALAAGDPAGALAEAETAGKIVAGFGITIPRAFAWRNVAAVACVQLGDGSTALRHAQTAVAEARACGTPRPLAMALVALGSVVAQDEAVDVLREAATIVDRSPALLARMEALVALGSALRQIKHDDEAREALFAGFELAERSGAVVLAAAARRELNALGHRPRRAARTGAGALTPAEARVAELAANGLSTPQIAHHLVISPRTVETHLARAFRKLNVARRTELPSALGR